MQIFNNIAVLSLGYHKTAFTVRRFFARTKINVKQIHFDCSYRDGRFFRYSFTVIIQRITKNYKTFVSLQGFVCFRIYSSNTKSFGSIWDLLANCIQAIHNKGGRRSFDKFLSINMEGNRWQWFVASKEILITSDVFEWFVHWCGVRWRAWNRLTMQRNNIGNIPCPKIANLKLHWFI